jgi:hypothetical protein
MRDVIDGQRGRVEFLLIFWGQPIHGNYQRALALSCHGEFA